MKTKTHPKQSTSHLSSFFSGASPKNTPFFPPTIQRQCAECEQEGQLQRQQVSEEEEPVQMMPLMRKSENGGYQATSKLTSQLSQSKGGGSSLPAPTRSYMSKAFGTDFSQVRVHTGSQAQEMSQGIQAKAFTHGSDIYFNKGQYNPESSDGKKLLAHELTHVVQQGKTFKNIQRTAQCPSRLLGSAPVPRGWRDYGHDTSWFHCGFRVILEDRMPTPEDPQGECVYDHSGNLVDENHEYAGCRGTPNDYDNSQRFNHTFRDRGGIWHRGWGAYRESRRYDRDRQRYPDDPCHRRCEREFDRCLDSSTTPGSPQCLARRGTCYSFCR